MGSGFVTSSPLGAGVEQWLPLLVHAALQATVLLLLVFALSAVMRQASAAVRHLVWSLGLAGLLAVPMLSAAMPWRLEVLPPAMPSIAANPAIAEPLAGPAREATSAAPAIEASRAGAAGISDPDAGARALALSAPPVEIAIPAERQSVELSLGMLLNAALALWLAGMALILARLGVGMLHVRGLVRRARPLSSADWAWPLQRIVDRHAGSVPVRLLRSEEVPMPITVGVVRPVIVMPASADGWSDERRRAVLLHELAHVRRMDLLTLLFARVACAIYWFNPLVWMAARRLRAESERACDDLVLNTGTHPSEYAEHLLSIVRAAGRGRAPVAALPFAQRSDFEGRLLAILEPGLKRHGLTRASALLVTAAIAASAVPLAAMGPRRPAAPVADAVASSDVAALHMEPAAAIIEAAEQEPVTPTPMPTPTPEPEPRVNAAEIRAATRQALQTLDVRISRADLEQEHDGHESGLTEAAVAALGSALRDPDADVRYAAAKSLGSAEDPRSVEALSQALRTDTDSEVRRMSAWALGEIEDARAVPALAAAIRQDKTMEVRKMAAWALGEIEDASGVEPLGAALRDGAPEVRRMAVWALGEIESAAAVPLLAPLLRDADVETRKQTAWALGEIESAEAVEPLAAAVRDEAPEVRRMAVWALGEIESARGATAIASALADSDAETRRKAAWALGELGDLGQAPPALIAALRDQDRQVRRSAAHALGEIADPAAAAALAAAARDEDQQVRRSAVWALAEIGGPDAMEALVALLKDDDPAVRKMAAEALGNRH